MACSVKVVECVRCNTCDERRAPAEFRILPCVKSRTDGASAAPFAVVQAFLECGQRVVVNESAKACVLANGVPELNSPALTVTSILTQHISRQKSNLFLIPPHSYGNLQCFEALGDAPYSQNLTRLFPIRVPFTSDAELLKRVCRQIRPQNLVDFRLREVLRGNQEAL